MKKHKHNVIRREASNLYPNENNGWVISETIETHKGELRYCFYVVDKRIARFSSKQEAERAIKEICSVA